MHYVVSNVLFLKMELSKKFVNANFMKNQAFVVRKNLKQLENVNIINVQ